MHFLYKMISRWLNIENLQEEEKGIEMSEDFGGRSQDLDKKDDENDSDAGDEDEDELDKEMGETGEEAETLDQQVNHIFEIFSI